jgi:hypothetical protein
MDIQLLFHLSLQEPVHSNPLPGEVIPTREPVIVKGKLEYKVEEVLDSTIFRYLLQYLIKW